MIYAEPLRITLHPNDKTKHCKQGTMLTVRASGSGTITYQWMKDGEFLSEDDLSDCIGATTDTLQFLSLTSEHSGTYVCRVYNENASVESKTAVLKGECNNNISFLCSRTNNVQYC